MEPVPFERFRSGPRALRLLGLLRVEVLGSHLPGQRLCMATAVVAVTAIALHQRKDSRLMFSVLSGSERRPLQGLDDPTP